MKTFIKLFLITGKNLSFHCEQMHPFSILFRLSFRLDSTRLSLVLLTFRLRERFSTSSSVHRNRLQDPIERFSSPATFETPQEQRNEFPEFETPTRSEREVRPYFCPRMFLLVNALDPRAPGDDIAVSFVVRSAILCIKFSFENVRKTQMNGIEVSKRILCVYLVIFPMRNRRAFGENVTSTL